MVGELPKAKKQIIRSLHETDELLKGGKILVVDDDMRTTFALSRLLSDRGMMRSLHEDLPVVDSQHLITDVNDSCLVTLGKHSRDEVIGNPYHEVIYKYHLHNDSDSADDFIQDVFTNGLPRASMYEYQNNDGATGHVEITLSPLKDKSRKVTNVVAAIHDDTEIVTARKVAENAHRKLSMAINSVKIFFGDWDIPDKTMTYSTEWRARLGYSDEKKSDDFSLFQELLHADDKESTLKYLQDLAGGERDDYAAEFRLRHKDGSYCWMFCRAQGVRDESRKIQGIIGCNIDITEKKNEEARRVTLQKQLIESQKMESVGRLAGGIAHDFNNLLTIILNYATLTLETLPENSPITGDIQEIRHAGERAAGLTRQLLAFSRKQVIEPVPLKLNQVITDIEKMLHRILGEDINLEKGLDPDLGMVLADPGQIEQIILNMAVNARDAMPEGGKLTIETANVELDEEYVSRIIVDTHIS